MIIGAAGYIDTVETPCANSYDAFSEEVCLKDLNLKVKSTICDIWFAELENCLIKQSAILPPPTNGCEISLASIASAVNNADENLLTGLTVKASLADADGAEIDIVKGMSFQEDAIYTISGRILNWTKENYQALRKYRPGCKMGFYYGTEGCCLFGGDAGAEGVQAIIGTFKTRFPLAEDGRKSIEFEFVFEAKMPPVLYEITGKCATGV